MATINPIREKKMIEVETIKHDEMVKALVKDGATIAREIDANDAHLMHMAIGVSGEAGELLDAIKKRVIYRKELDRENVMEELGDIEFYLEGLRQGLGITREQCLVANILKLGKRYVGLKYSDQAAQERKDKALAEGGAEADFYVVRSGASGVFVKEAAFFEEQGGLTDSWGKSWTKVRAVSIEHARNIGETTL